MARQLWFCTFCWCSALACAGLASSRSHWSCRHFQGRSRCVRRLVRIGARSLC